MPIFNQLANICPEINDLQLESGQDNIEKWKIRAEHEKRLKEKEDKRRALIAGQEKDRRDSSEGSGEFEK